MGRAVSRSTAATCTSPIPQVVDLVVPVIGRKSQHQLVLRECLLEMAPKAILYGP